MVADIHFRIVMLVNTGRSNGSFGSPSYMFPLAHDMDNMGAESQKQMEETES
jgi:hypothetical protein